MAMTKDQIKEAAKAIVEAKKAVEDAFRGVVEAEKAVEDAYKVLEAAQSVFTNDYREGGLLDGLNFIEVDGKYWELVIDVENAEFQHLRPSSYPSSYSVF